MTKQEYMKQVGKGLECSAAKKSEILKQLDSDIEIGLGEGRELSKILEEMGTPKILAGEFNENLEEKERKNAIRRKRRKRILCILGAVLAVLAGNDMLVTSSSEDQVQSVVDAVAGMTAEGKYPSPVWG